MDTDPGRVQGLYGEVCLATCIPNLNGTPIFSPTAFSDVRIALFL